MKKLFFLLICIIFAFAQSNQTSRRKYEVCKANCDADCGCGLAGFNCEHDCYRHFCRTECFEKHNKACKACFEKSQNKKGCFDSPACKGRKECLDECEFVHGVSTKNLSGESNYSNSEYCSECYCFKGKTKEFLGKLKNPKNVCLECDLNCKNAYKKLKVFDIQGICRNLEK